VSLGGYPDRKEGSRVAARGHKLLKNRVSSDKPTQTKKVLRLMGVRQNIKVINVLSVIV